MTWRATELVFAREMFHDRTLDVYDTESIYEVDIRDCTYHETLRPYIRVTNCRNRFYCHEERG